MRALVVEDDPHVRDVIVGALRSGGYSTSAAGTGPEGDALAAEGGFDVALIDWNLPGLQGVELIRRLREAKDTTAVVMVTARDTVGDRVTGLDYGADDYVIKPFHVDELLARVRAVVRRKGSQAAAVFVEGAVELNTVARTAQIAGRPLSLTTREFDLFEFLLRNAGIALSRQDLEEQMWGSAFEGNSNVLEVMVARLRRKLGDASRIETVRGFGYRFKRESVTEQ